MGDGDRFADVTPPTPSVVPAVTPAPVATTPPADRFADSAPQPVAAAPAQDRFAEPPSAPSQVAPQALPGNAIPQQGRPMGPPASADPARAETMRNYRLGVIGAGVLSGEGGKALPPDYPGADPEIVSAIDSGRDPQTEIARIQTVGRAIARNGQDVHNPNVWRQIASNAQGIRPDDIIHAQQQYEGGINDRATAEAQEIRGTKTYQDGYGNTRTEINAPNATSALRGGINNVLGAVDTLAIDPILGTHLAPGRFEQADVDNQAGQINDPSLSGSVKRAVIGSAPVLGAMAAAPELTSELAPELAVGGTAGAIGLGRNIYDADRSGLSDADKTRAVIGNTAIDALSGTLTGLGPLKGAIRSGAISRGVQGAVKDATGMAGINVGTDVAHGAVNQATGQDPEGLQHAADNAPTSAMSGAILGGGMHAVGEARDRFQETPNVPQPEGPKAPDVPVHNGPPGADTPRAVSPAAGGAPHVGGGDTRGSPSGPPGVRGPSHGGPDSDAEPVNPAYAWTPSPSAEGSALSDFTPEQRAALKAVQNDQSAYLTLKRKFWNDNVPPNPKGAPDGQRPLSAEKSLPVTPVPDEHPNGSGPGSPEQAPEGDHGQQWISPEHEGEATSPTPQKVEAQDLSERGPEVDHGQADRSAPSVEVRSGGRGEQARPKPGDPSQLTGGREGLHVADGVTIEHDHDVPYGGGADVNDPNTIHEDRGIPTDMDFGNGIRGDATKTVAVHEVLEARLRKGGMSYEVAHQHANAAERQEVEKQGGDWDTYSKNITPHLNAARAKGKAGTAKVDPGLDKSLYQGKDSKMVGDAPHAVDSHAPIGNPHVKTSQIAPPKAFPPKDNRPPVDQHAQSLEQLNSIPRIPGHEQTPAQAHITSNFKHAKVSFSNDLPDHIQGMHYKDGDQHHVVINAKTARPSDYRRLVAHEVTHASLSDMAPSDRFGVLHSVRDILSAQGTLSKHLASARARWGGAEGHEHLLEEILGEHGAASADDGGPLHALAHEQPGFIKRFIQHAHDLFSRLTGKATPDSHVKQIAAELHGKFLKNLLDEGHASELGAPKSLKDPDVQREFIHSLPDDAQAHIRRKAFIDQRSNREPPVKFSKTASGAELRDHAGDESGFHGFWNKWARKTGNGHLGDFLNAVGDKLGTVGHVLSIDKGKENLGAKMYQIVIRQKFRDESTNLAKYNDMLQPLLKLNKTDMATALDILLKSDEAHKPLEDPAVHNPAVMAGVKAWRDFADYSLAEQAQTVHQALGQGRQANPFDTSHYYNAMHSGNLNPGAHQAYKLAAKSIEALDGLHDQAYFPGTRFGKFEQVIRQEPDQNGDLQTTHFIPSDSPAETKAALDQIAKDHPKDPNGVITIRKPSQAARDLSEISERKIRDLATAAGVDPAAVDKIMGDGFSDFLKARTNFGAHMVKRNNIKGRSDDVRRVAADYAAGLARNLANSAMERRAEPLMNKIKTKDEALHTYLDGVLKYVRGSQQEYAAARGAVALAFLGGKVSTGTLFGALQSPMIAGPVMFQHGGMRGVGELVRAHSNLTRRLAKVAHLLTLGKFDMSDFAAKSLDSSDPQLASDLRAAKRAGDLNSFNDNELNKAAGKQTVASTVAHQTSRVLMHVLSTMEQSNRIAAYIAGHRLATAKQGSPQFWSDMENQGFAGPRTPANAARYLVDKSQFTYNKGNRAAWQKGGAGVLSSLMSFPINQSQLAYRMGMAAAGRGGASPALRARSAGALAAMMAVVGGLSGVWGMFPGGDVVHHLVGDKGGDAVNHGMLYAMTKGNPNVPDPSGLASIGGLFGGGSPAVEQGKNLIKTVYNTPALGGDADPKERARAPGIVPAIADHFQAPQEDDWANLGRSLANATSATKNLAQGIEEKKTGMIQNASGTPLAPATGQTANMKMLGFNSMEAQGARNDAAEEKQKETQNVDPKARLVENIEDALQSGDHEALGQALAALKAHNEAATSPADIIKLSPQTFRKDARQRALGSNADVRDRPKLDR